MYMAKKVRTQLYLTQEQRKVLEKQSRLTGKSAGELVREAVDEVYLRERPQERQLSKEDPIWGLVGAGSSSEADISARHDDYLYGNR